MKIDLKTSKPKKVKTKVVLILSEQEAVNLAAILGNTYGSHPFPSDLYESIDGLGLDKEPTLKAEVKPHVGEVVGVYTIGSI